MTNETKESLREELEVYVKDFQFLTGRECTNEDVFYWWLSKLDQALKSQREEIKEKIVSIPIKNENGSDYEMAQLRYREKVLSLIQNK